MAESRAPTPLSVKADPGIVPSGFFVLRTPLLPFDELEAWSSGLEAPAVSRDAAALEQALAADRERLRGRLRTLVLRSEVLDALRRLAQPLGKPRGLAAEPSERAHPRR